MTNSTITAKYLLVLPWEIKYPGGVNQVVTNIYNEFQSHGQYQPILLVNEWENTKLTIKQNEGFITAKYRLRDPFDSKKPIKGFISYLFTAPARIYTLSKLLRNQKIEVVNPHYPTLAALNFSLLKWLGLFKGKLVLSFHGTDIANAALSVGIKRAWWKCLLGSADCIVTCSEYLAQKVVEFSPNNVCKIKVINNGVNYHKLIADDYACADTIEIDDNCRFILNIGSFERIKGQDVLIRAFKEINHQFPDVYLVLIGRSGEAEVYLKRLVKELGMCDRIKMIKDLQHKNTMAYLKKASLFVLPSRSESFGITILESGVFGVPVVASEVGGVMEILEQGKTGRLVPADDQSALSANILLLLKNPYESRIMASNLQNNVMQEFTWEKVYRQYVKIIEEKEDSELYKRQS